MSRQHKVDLKSIIAGNSPEEAAPEMAVSEPPVVEAVAESPSVIPLPTAPQTDVRATRRAAAKDKKAAGQGTLRERTRQQSLYLELPVYEQLRELAFHERKAMHTLILEGLDLLFKKRGLKSQAQLTKDAQG